MTMVVLKDNLVGVRVRVAEGNLRVERILRLLLDKRDEALERPVTVVVNEIESTSGFEL